MLVVDNVMAAICLKVQKMALVIVVKWLTKVILLESFT